MNITCLSVAACLWAIATFHLRWSSPANAQPVVPVEIAQMNPLLTPDTSLIDAAVQMGKEAVKRKMSEDQLLMFWSQRVPEAEGYVVPLVPPVLIAAAAFDTAKYHKDEATLRQRIAAIIQQGQEHLTFRVVLRSKGSGTWLWPRGMKPGDRRALDSIKFVLANDQEQFFQAMDFESQKRITAQNKELGLPFGVSTYIPVGSWYFSLPLSLGGTRQDFEARYEPTFALKDANGKPALSQQCRSFSLRVIGATDEKSVVFDITQLLDKVKSGKISRR